MPTFVIVNRAPLGHTGSADAMAAWNVWFDRLGASLADRGNPVFHRAVVGNCGTGTVLGGYTVVTADDLDTAVALTTGCPALVYGGGVEVGELVPLNRGIHQNLDGPA